MSVSRPSGAAADAQADLVAAASAAADPTSPVPTSVLPAILGNVPVAVLLIDQGTGEVTYANQAALELAGDVSLPLSADRWGAAAGLTDLDGQPLAGTDAPLSRVAIGRPVAGEPVRMAPRRSNDPDRARSHDVADDQLLWVTGFPMSAAAPSPTAVPQAPGLPAPAMSLVVFLPVADPAALQGADAETALARLREGAVLATDISFTITDPRQDDAPLVWVNPSFTRVTGYSYEESVGRNCRFLQGPTTAPAALSELREALRNEQAVTVTLLNHRKDGTAFWNQLSISPVLDGEGKLVSFVGVQSDVTARVVADAERDRALRAESVARQAAENAQTRLLLMAEGTSQLSASLDAAVLQQRLVDLCVPFLCDWAFVAGLDENGLITDSAAAHASREQSELQGLIDLMAARAPHPGSPTAQVIASGDSQLINGLTPEKMAPFFRTTDGAQLATDLGVKSLLTVPMTARGRTLGVLSLIRSGSDFRTDDVDVATDLGRRAAMAIDNARLYQQKQSVAEILQRALLPNLPDIAGVTAVAHYQSASSEAAVGGDFYDLIELPGGAFGLAIGDVAGHDINAAAEMGQLRGLLRACAYEGDPTDPGRVLDRLDALVLGLRLGTLATVTYACVLRREAGDPATDAWELHVATAGHPPLVIHTPEGTVRELTEVRGLMIGVDATRPRSTTTYQLSAGSTVLAYTDGLVEHRGTDLDAGTADLLALLAQVGPHPAPAQLARTAMTLADNRLDDVACLAVTLH